MNLEAIHLFARVSTPHCFTSSNGEFVAKERPSCCFVVDKKVVSHKIENQKKKWAIPRGVFLLSL